MTPLTLILAFTIDLLWGDPPSRYHPVAAMGAFIRWGAKHAAAKRPLHQFLYGALVTISGAALFSLPLVALDELLRPYPVAKILLHAVLLKFVFSVRGLLSAAREVEIALENNDVSGARRIVGWHLVSRETQTLSAGHVASATTESLAENLADSLVAPLLAYAVGGLPLAWAYRFVNTADAMIGYRTERYEYLGKFAARLDDLLNWIPSRLSGLLIALAAPMIGGNFTESWRVMIAQHARDASPNAGWPMSAAAGALRVTLEKIDCHRFEGGEGLPNVDDIARARRLIAVAATAWVAGQSAFALFARQWLAQ